MKKIIRLILSLVLTVAASAQQYNVTATPQGVIKPLPNGVVVKTTAGGADQQIQYNNAGVIGGFTASGDATIVPSTGVVTIANGAVNNAKLAQMPAQSIKGNNAVSAGPSMDLSAAQAKSLLAIVPGDITGLGSIATQNSNNVNISGGTISGANVTGLAPPVNGTDAVNLNYVSGLSAGITPRTGVAVATTANITLSGEQTIDGVLTSASRVLVKNQSTTSQNGIYTSAAGAWSRASDSNTAGTLKFGYYYFVSAGTTQAATSWFIQTAPVVLNTDPVLFSQFSASQSYYASTGLSLVGNVFSLNPTQSGLTINSSAFNGTVGATTPSTGVFTVGTVTGAGSSPYFRSFSSTFSVDGRVGSIFDSSLFGVGTTSSHNVGIFRGNVQVGLFTAAGFNGAVGATTPSTGAFTTLNAGGAPFGAAQFEANATSTSAIGGANSSAAVATGIIWNRATSGDTYFLRLYTESSITERAALYWSRTTGLNLTTGLAVAGPLQANGVINVKTYGATGDGATNDTAAIAAAVAALPSSNAVLYFPSGTYITDAITITGKTGLSVIGDGNGVTTLKGRTGNRVLVISTTTGCTVRGIGFNGNCTTRTAGQQAVVIDASNLLFTENSIINSGEFAIMIGDNAAVNNVRVIGNYIGNNYADGINIRAVTDFVVADNVVNGADDDCIAIGYSVVAGYAAHGVVSGNSVKARTDLGTNFGRGIWVGPASDILVVGNNVDTVKQTGIYVNNDGTGVRPTRITIRANKVRNVAINSGHGIEATTTAYVSIEGNTVENQASGNSIEIADWQAMTIKDNTLTQASNVFARGIHADEGTSWAAATWTNLVISGNTIRMLGASTNSCIYLVPNGIYGMQGGCVIGTQGQQVSAGDYITISTATASSVWKVGNNTTLTSGRTINSGGVLTLFNNN